MKQVFTTLGLLAFLLAGCSAMGDREMASGHHGKDMKQGHARMSGMMTKMDANRDGLLTKDEFMQAHEAMFDRMKGPDGVISLKDMHQGHHSMRGDSAGGQGHAGHGGMNKGGMDKGGK